MPPIDALSASVIVPTFNGAGRIGKCLRALLAQTTPGTEILVVDDGSTDDTAEVVRRFPQVRLVVQSNGGPAAARNRGAREARGDILLFTDDDCIPTSGWLRAMLSPFTDPQVVGAKGIYRTRQRKLVARFVQLEYEDRYRLMAGLPAIDFIDTYSAAYRRERFLEMNGYDTSFPVACAEDVELSFRMSARNWRMKFAPKAEVYHTHPDTLSWYLRKKYKFAFWRVIAVQKNPSKAVKDSHTPQTMKLQLLFLPLLVLAILLDLLIRPAFPLSAVVVAAFVVSTLPFAVRAFREDALVGLLSPALLACRSGAQFLGVAGGLIYSRRTAVAGAPASTPVPVATPSPQSRYVLQLRHLLSAEKQTLSWLERTLADAYDPSLKAAFEAHLAETRTQIVRLSEMLAEFAANASGAGRDSFITALLQSANEIRHNQRPGPGRDAELIALGRTIEHYEIASYSTACDWALQFGFADQAETLRKILQEEQLAEETLSAMSLKTAVSTAA